MDLELTDEQQLLGEALTTLLQREWPPAESAHTATAQQRTQLWSALQEFFDDELGAVELCLAARALGTHLASAPFIGSAALRYAGVSHSERIAIALPDTPVEHAHEVDRFAVIADGTVALATATATEPAATLDVGIPLSNVTFDTLEPVDADAARLTAIGALLAAAESVGAAERMLSDARDYAAERRQFGRTIGSYQALRHILADMYVRRVSAW